MHIFIALTLAPLANPTQVKDVLAYLQLIDNPAFVPALTRIVNVPARGIGEKVRNLSNCRFEYHADHFQTLNDISRRSQESGKTHIQLLEGIYDGRLPDQKPTIRKKIASFVQVMRALRTYASEVSTVVTILPSRS